MSTKLNLPKLFGYAGLAVFGIISLLPIWMALKTAITMPTDVFSTANSLWVNNPVFGNFLRVLGLPSDVPPPANSGSPINFMIALRNSVIYTGLLVTGQLFFSSLAAYAFARLRFPGRDAIFYSFIAATMIPSIVLFIPNFILIRQLGLLNSFAGMVAPNILMLPFAVFFLRQFFLSTPKELEEAARLDGLSWFKVYWHIALPLQRGPLATLAILLSIQAWNDFFWPFLVGQKENVQVMAVALANYQSQTGQGQPDWTGLMAAVMLSIIPVLILLVFFGRRIVESLQTSGMK
ncbi:carbohydrate ABC transporter permease [Cohaesibacter haloalkalitolerans]|uniref:carbohydrate ABC transporter permease n=1 Tax=Cohaesibacter haloalkalitolerans TaxID=1162980 RepID=UPI000E6479ED|nr:carbohydrate ABC transporter permease [Cohaesibacter haloalkalitolerans]